MPAEGAEVILWAVMLLLYDHPDRVNDSRNVPQQRQQDVQPEMLAQPNLQEDPQRRQKDSDDNAN